MALFGITELEKTLREMLREQKVESASPIVVAVSGGADSTALLDSIVRLWKKNELPSEIFVAHLNHLLRADESDADERFVQEMAARLKLPIVVERIAIAEQSEMIKQNLEATARQVRYDFLRRAAEKCAANVVLTAHTLDDQAETFLMRLLRGSGMAGLRGIHPVRHLSESIRLIRPLLGITRSAVIEHCERYRLEYRTDSSNFSSDLTRNRIRQELIPLLRSFNPRSNEALGRMADLLAEDQTFLEQVAADALAEVRLEADLDARLLHAHPLAIRRRVLRLWLRERRGLQRIEAVHLAAIEKLIAQGRGGRTIELPGGWQVRLKSGKLTLTKVEKQGRI